MDFELKVSQYELFPKSTLGKLGAKRSRKGVLCRFRFEDGMEGYSDLHAWPELGDLPLAEQISLLRQGKFTPLSSQALWFARQDAQARFRGQSLWEGVGKIPPSHFLVTDLSRLSLSRLETLSDVGFDRLKIKLGPLWREDAARLASWVQELNRFSFLLRLDLNSSFSRDEFEELLEMLGPARKLLDFVEDPFPYDSLAWGQVQGKWKVRLALDRIPNDPKVEFQAGSFSVLIHKPAIQEPRWALDLAKSLDISLAITSYLGHPLGQLSAAWVAATVAAEDSCRMEQCGLLSHEVYEQSVFSTKLVTQGPILLPPSGNGIGWEDHLRKLEWL
jgi:O-succinylbenzoate synthase